VKKFKSSHSEDVSINDIHPIQPPVFRILFNQAIDLLAVLRDAKDKTLHEIISFRTFGKMFIKLNDDPDGVLFRNL